MSSNNGLTRSHVYKRLKKGFREFSDMFNVHLEDGLLREMGVDALCVDLEEETTRGGAYFLPLSQERMDSMNTRPDCRVTIPDEISSSIWSFGDADIVHLGFEGQLYYNEGDWQTWEGTHWEPRRYKSTYQKLLYENNCFDDADPTRQMEWRLQDHLVAEGFPHRSYISLAEVPDVQGLIRSEMMSVTGMMVSAMREKRNEDITIMPLVLVSIIGRFARVIQAHVSLDEQQLKVRYSQLYDFNNCSQRQMDLFLRWILGSPLVEPKPQDDADETPGSPIGDTAPRMTVSKSPSEARNVSAAECCKSNEPRISTKTISAVG